ncbi:MAG: hypothetical protein KC503_37780 [Myxococcales bacterium]|nr:hypothetical protein [Myxococcales bacterium]
MGRLLARAHARGDRENPSEPRVLISGDFFFAGAWTDRRVSYFDARGWSRAPRFIRELELEAP